MNRKFLLSVISIAAISTFVVQLGIASYGTNAVIKPKITNQKMVTKEAVVSKEAKPRPAAPAKPMSTPSQQITPPGLAKPVTKPTQQIKKIIKPLKKKKIRQAAQKYSNLKYTTPIIKK